MNLSVTRTRVIIPRLRPDLLSRDRVLAHLQKQKERKLLIIVAPPGYGKTSLLLDFVHPIRESVCWYSVDSLDDNPQRFLAHILASIKHVFPTFGAESHAALQEYSRTGDSLYPLVTTIVNELYDCVQDRLILIIDDFHLVSDNEAILTFINLFIQQVSDNCQIILSSRKLLRLPDLPLMVARSMVGGLSWEELAFQTDELQALMWQNYGQEMDDLSALEMIDTSEGWITGLLLSTQLGGNQFAEQSRMMRATGVDIYDYLAQQVLNQQEKEVQSFLLRTSLLEEFSETLCREILTPLLYHPDTDWHKTIELVVSNNLFILPVEDGEPWYRYHNLFKEFLQRRLRTVAPEEEQLILENLAIFYTRREEWEKAYRIRKRQGNLPQMADIIELASLALVQTYQWTLLNNWLDELPMLLRNEHPYLLALEGYALTVRGIYSEGFVLMDSAIARLANHPSQMHLATSFLWRCMARRQQGYFEESLRDADEALGLLDSLKQLPGHRVEAVAMLRAEALNSKGIIYSMLGELTQGIAFMEEAASQYTALGNHGRVAILLNDLATAHMNAGFYTEALRLFHQAQDKTQALQHLLPQAHILNNLGVLYHLMGDYQKAYKKLTQAVSLAQRTQDLFFQALSLASLGDIFVDLMDDESANECYAEALELASKMESQYLLLYIDLARSQLASAKREWLQAYDYLDAASRRLPNLRSIPEWNLYQMAMGRFYLSRDNHEKAIAIFEEAVKGTHTAGQRIEEAVSRVMLATAFFRAGEDAKLGEQLVAASAVVQSLEVWQPIIAKGQLSLDLLNYVSEAHPDRLIIQWPGISPQKIEEIITFCRGLLARMMDFQRVSGEIHRQIFQTCDDEQESTPTDHSNEDTQLIIRTLGRIEVSYNGQPIRTCQWQSQVARNLFLCLVVHHEGLTKEEIGEIFWPDSAPAQLKVRFKNAIYRLRRALFPDAILFENDRYQFNRAIDHGHDAEAFQRAIAAAKEATSPLREKKAYQDAIHLYKGEYLPEVEGMWAWLERERLNQLYLDASLRLAELHLDYAELVEALTLCQTALSIDPCLEDAHRIAMRIHAAGGNQAAVIRQYELCEASLRDEFDASPSEQTQRLLTILIH